MFKWEVVTLAAQHLLPVASVHYVWHGQDKSKTQEMQDIRAAPWIEGKGDALRWLSERISKINMQDLERAGKQEH